MGGLLDQLAKNVGEDLKKDFDKKIAVFTKRFDKIDKKQAEIDKKLDKILSKL